MKPIFFLILIAIGFAVWIVAYVIYKFFGKSVTKSYSQLSLKYNLKLDENNKEGGYKLPFATGEYRGIPIQIGTLLNQRKIKGPSTIITSECENKESLSFSIVKRTRQNMDTYGLSESPLADREFDEKFIINTNNFPEFQTLMSFNAKYKLIQASQLGAAGELSLKENQIIYSEPGYIKGDTGIMITEILIHLICDIAEDMKRIKPVVG